MFKLPIKCSSCGKERFHYGACDCIDGQLWEINQRREGLEREIERLRAALEAIADNCDPNDPPWKDAEKGRIDTGDIARAALDMKAEIERLNASFNLLRDAVSWFDAHEVEKKLGHLPQWVVSARNGR
jgi:hypothetical protein